MGLDLEVIIMNLIIVLVMVLPCVFLLVHGSWIVASEPEQAVSPKQLMEFLSGSKTRPIAITMRL